MKINKLAAAMLLTGSFYSVPALADHHGHAGMHGDMGKQCPQAECGEHCKHECTKDLEARLAALEAKSATNSSSAWTWGADIEVEGSWGENYAGEHESDIVVATAYLSLEGKINK